MAVSSNLEKRVLGVLGGMLALLIPVLIPAGAEAGPDLGFAEAGRFYVQNFAPEDYEAHSQNWAIAQAPDGLLYVGNGNGVLEYDGASWRLIRTANRSLARSLAVGDGGQVFVGADGELGYLDPDAQGRMRYVSLVDRIAAEDRDFNDVWTVATTSEGVYFHTRERLFRWDGQEMKIWRADTRFHTCFAVGDVLHIRQHGVGLMRMDEDSLVLAPGGALFQDKRVYGLVPWGEGESVAVTREHGVFRCPTALQAAAAEGGSACTPFATDSTELLVSLQPYRATTTPDGILVIATLRGGAVLLDREGRLLRVLDKASGLRHQSVIYSLVDRQGGLWLALDNGLARVELGSPLSHWNEQSGLIGTATDVARHKGRLYATTNLGVFRLEPGVGGAAQQFRPVPGIPDQCFLLTSTPWWLLAGCNSGLFDVERQQRIGEYSGAVFTVHISRRDPELLYMGLPDGLARMRFPDGQWGDFERIAGVRSQVHTITEDAAGRLWLGTSKDGVLRVELPGPSSEDPASPIVTRFCEADGLPTGWAEVAQVAGRVLVKYGSAGLFRLDEQAGGFVPDTTFDDFLPRGSIQRLVEDEQGRVWFAAGESSGVALPAAAGGYSWQPTALRRAGLKSVYEVRVEPGQALWLAHPQGLTRYDTSHSLETSTDYPVWIRRVSTGVDSLIYSGGGPAESSSELRYRDNTLRFAFAAPRYDASEQTRYRVRLDGFDDDWSAWTDETDKDYTNLWEGRYVFRVQARDVYGIVSREANFAVRILPPWYRSWWAYSLYILAVATALAGFVRSQERKVDKERAAAEREREVNRQLREVDRLKDEFLAATSHELRTPLYGITGLAESLAVGARGEMSASARQDLDMIVSSGRRLSRLVDDILDFSKLRHSSLEIDRRAVELHALVDIVLTLSRPLVADKDIELVNSVSAELPPALADENRVQQILHNLVGNAIKFTDSGCVEVTAQLDGARLVVEVADTGIGIGEADSERIFAAFEQADSSLQRRFGGTGLGLTVSRQLVELHGGKLWLESTSDAGSTFAFTLPVAAEAAMAPPPDTAPVEVLTALESPAEPDGGGAPRAASPVAKTNGNHARILVVDDEPVNRRVLANHLEAVGYRVVLAADGPEAMRRFDKQSFDLVLLDIMMPRMSGYEVCRALRERFPAQELPVLFLTAKARLEDQVSGLAEGANDYLTKPVAKDALLARVRTHVGLLEAHRKQLAGLVPICSQCKKIRDDEGYWEQIESFLASRSELLFSHGMCPPCTEEFIAQVKAEKSLAT